MHSLNNQVILSIRRHGPGWAFSTNDFIEDFSRAQIDNALSDLAISGKIRRVLRGVYDRPQFSELLQQELSPDFDQVAQALARKFHWRIQPCGDAALNLLGVSTQVPGRPIYLSDGPSRQYAMAGCTLEFKRASLKDMGFKHRESGLIVHALKALGEDGVSEAVITTIRDQLDEATRRRVLKDTVTATGWVYDVIKKICKVPLPPEKQKAATRT